jgi:hypothetical protein
VDFKEIARKGVRGLLRLSAVSVKGKEFLDKLSDYQLLNMGCVL